MNDLETHIQTLMTLIGEGHLGEASDLAGMTASRFPGSDQAWFLAGATYHQLGRLAEALHAFSRAIELSPLFMQAWNAKATVLSQLGRHKESLDIVQKLLKESPNDPQLLTNAGVLQELAGDLQLALNSYEQALKVHPDWFPALMNRGGVLLRLRRFDDALEHNLRVVKLYPNLADAHFNCAEVLLALLRPGDALAACEQALKLDPNHVKAMIDRGLALSEMGRLVEAQIVFDCVRKLEPSALDKFVNLYQTAPTFPGDRFDPALIYVARGWEHFNHCDWTGRKTFLADYERLVRQIIQRDGLNDTALAYNALSLPVSAQVQRDIARTISKRASAEVVRIERIPFSYRKHSGRIRVGYVSPDIREHLNAYLTLPIFRLHNREQFEIFCYSIHEGDGSQIRLKIKSAVEHFRDAAHLADNELAGLINVDGVSILVDLGGYTAFSRPGIFAHRPAPIQVSYLGFPGTLGAEYVQYRVTDPIVTPEDSASCWDEKLVFLPDTFYIYDNSEDLAEVGVARADYGIPDHAVVFCCFHNYYKIDPDIFDVWMRLLKRVPESLLWLQGWNPIAIANLQREAENRGVSPDRLKFAPFESRERYRARFRLADMFLDTLVFNGMTTACDALWAGLPVITCPGEKLASRVATSLLTAIGLREGIALDLTDYENKAFEWATNRDRLNALKVKLRENRNATPLFDTARQVRHLEAAYEVMLETYLSGKQPTSFKVARMPTRRG
jgi:protein O-GlcNAc transferase